MMSSEQFRRLPAAVEQLSGPGRFEEQGAVCLLRKISADAARMITVVAWTGMRRGELMALRWDDIQDGELHIERAVWRREEKATKTEEKATKTDDPRPISIVPPTKDALEAQRRWLPESQHQGLASGPVFTAKPASARAAERAGLNPVYDTATSEAVVVMRERGLDISAHRSRNVRDLDLEPFDVIVALTPSIAVRLPPVDRPERIVVWNIDDPYGGDHTVYRSCAAAINEKLKTLRIGRDQSLPVTGNAEEQES